MNIADHLWLRQREKVPVVQQILFRIFEAIPTDVGFLHAVGTNGGTHRSINDGDTILENLF